MMQDESFFALFYPHDPNLWIAHVGPSGAMEKWLRSDRRAPLASYLTEEVLLQTTHQHVFVIYSGRTTNLHQEKATHQQIMHGSHRSALNWYHALVGNLNAADERSAGLTGDLNLPTLLVCPQPSRLEFPGVEENMRLAAKDLTFGRVSTKGHWMQLEARDEVNETLKEFFDRLDGIVI